MAIKIGITGGVGSGKSTVSRLLEVMGIPVYISDEESKRIVATDLVVRKESCDLAGEEVFLNGRLNKVLLTSYLFASFIHASQVNRIIHPRVKEHFRQWASHKGCMDIIGMESIILIESGFADEAGYIAMVYAPLEIRVDRTIRRDNTSREQIMQRTRSQMSDEEKCEQASFVIINDDKKPLIPQILELIAFPYRKIHYLCSVKNS